MDVLISVRQGGAVGSAVAALDVDAADAEPDVARVLRLGDLGRTDRDRALAGTGIAHAGETVGAETDALVGGDVGARIDRQAVGDLDAPDDLFAGRGIAVAVRVVEDDHVRPVVAGAGGVVGARAQQDPGVAAHRLGAGDLKARDQLVAGGGQTIAVRHAREAGHRQRQDHRRHGQRDHQFDQCEAADGGRVLALQALHAS